MGRTGISGRGLLERWGPNHCVDPIFTRFVDFSGNAEIALRVSTSIIMNFW